MQGKPILIIGKNIKKYRQRADLTQDKLAEKIGISLRYIQHIESGARIPTIPMLYKIAAALGKDIKNLF